MSNSSTPLPTPLEALHALYTALSGAGNESQALHTARRVLQAHTANEWTPDTIRALRQRNAWTQRDLAERLGCHIARVQEWEQGRATPGERNRRQLDTLNRQERTMATVTKISYGFLSGNLIGSETGYDEAASAENYADACEAALREAYPGADINIDWQLAEGSLPANLKTSVTLSDGTVLWAEGGDEPAEISTIERICDQVWESGTWAVEA